MEAPATATSKSAVSRRFVQATERALGELVGRDLSGLDVVAVMIDGVHFAEHLYVVALGVTADGTKVALGLVEGATENTTVVTGLLEDLRDRGLDVTRPVLVCIDGAKALRSAVVRIFDKPVIARCQLHKIRNVPLPARSGMFVTASAIQRHRSATPLLDRHRDHGAAHVQVLQRAGFDPIPAGSPPPATPRSRPSGSCAAAG